MADYYSILKKTIASLPESNGAARRSVYSRARNAIVNQLKAYEPPLSPSEITAEQLRLEEAIRKVEAEAARESLGLTAPLAPETEASAPEPDQQPDDVAPVAEEPVESPSLEAQTPETPEPEVYPEAPLPAEEDVPSPLKDTLSEAEALGSAANQAVQNAKEAVEPAPAAPPPVSEQRQDPVFDTPAQADDGLFEPEKASSVPEEPPLSAGNKDAGASPKARARRDRPSASEALRGGSSLNRLIPIVLSLVVVLALVAAGAYFFIQRDDQVSVNRQQPDAEETQAAASGTGLISPDSAPGTDDEDGSSLKNTDRLLDDGSDDVVAPDARTVTTTSIDPQEVEPAASQPSIVTNVENGAIAPGSTTVDGVATPPTASEEPPAVLPDDNLAVVAPEEAAPENPAAGVTDSSSGVQRSILYEEGEDTGGAGTASQGAVVWGLEEETNLDGLQKSVLTASVDIPERDVKVDIRIKPNDDTSLPASHLVEIKYEFPDTFAAGDVVNVPGLVMKPTEEARGDALIGASVKVSPGIFWIALSSLPNEQQRNLALLRERGWIDIPMLYENGKRGILTLEKGSVGADAVEKAIADWQAL